VTYSRADRVRHDWLELYAHALTVACPRCERPVDEPCLNAMTGEQLAAPAHPQRITAADGHLGAELDDRHRPSEGHT
jgi:hypothetical protein